MKRGIRLASLLLIVTCLSLAALTAWQVWIARERGLYELNVDNLNLVQALDTYSEGVIKQCELVLLHLVERLESDGLGPQQLERLKGLLDQQQQVLSLLNAILVYDAQGRRLLQSSGDPRPGQGVADRAFFIHHRDDPSPEIFIGPTIKSRINGVWVFTVSRRINGPDGSFAGVAAVTLGVEQFLRLFGRLDVGEQGAVSLSRSNGQLLFRQPFREQDVGVDWSSSPILTHLSEVDEGTTTLTSLLDGVERIFAFRRNDRLPLVTIVAVGRDEALSAWRREAELFAAVILALVLAVGVIGQRLILDIRRRAYAEQQLLVARQELLEANGRLEVLASQDQLTGLANRRCFDQTLEVEVRRALRRGTPLSLILLDIDLFKHYNDRYGHVAGDACLRAIAEVLKQSVRRPGDLPARYGGEEMVVILPNTDIEGARAVAEGFLELLERQGLEHQASPLGRVSASIGVAGLAGLANGGDSDEEKALALIAAADEALYRAKANGRNRLEIAAPSPA